MERAQNDIKVVWDKSAWGTHREWPIWQTSIISGPDGNIYVLAGHIIRDAAAAWLMP